MAASRSTDPTPAVAEEIAKTRLEELARKVLDDPDEWATDVMPQVADWASPGLCDYSRYETDGERDRALYEAFENYVLAVEGAADFERGLIETYDIDPNAGSSAHAADIAAERVSKALDYLLHGPNGLAGRR
jgi:hypothetical protein